MSRFCLALLCLALPVVAGAEDPDSRTIAYEKLYAPLVAIQQADPDHIVTSALHAASADPDQPLPADLKVELRAGTVQQPLALDAQGRFSLPMHPEWSAGGATLWVNAPRTRVVIAEDFRMRTPASPRTTYAQLMESLPVMERIEKAQPGLTGMPSGKAAGIELAFLPGASQTVIVGSGAASKTWTSDDQGHLKIPFDPGLPATTPVAFSVLPQALRPYSPP